MDPLNLATASSPPSPPPPGGNDLLAKRKRGRPRKDDSKTQQENSQVNPNLVGKSIYGVVEGNFDAGYFLDVKVKDSDMKLRGLVFRPDKIIPVTPENDLFPHVKMYERDEINIDTDDQSSDAVTDLDISESAQPLSLMSQENNVEEEEAAATVLADFFQPQESIKMPGQPNLVLIQKNTREQQKSPGEIRGFDLMAEIQSCEGEKVPDELQLELGNKTIMSGDNNGISTYTEPKSSVSKSGFIAKLFEGEDKKGDIEEEATPSVQ